VSPRLPMKDGPDGGLVDSVLSCELGLTDTPRLVASAHVPNLIRRQFCETVALSTSLAAFRRHVGHVVGLRAEKQVAATGQQERANRVGAHVVIPDTETNVATVKHLHAGWYWFTCCERPGNPVDAAVAAGAGVSVRFRPSSPQPAAICFVDPQVEPFLIAGAAAVISPTRARQATESSVANSHAICPSHERGAAVFAGAWCILFGHRDHSSVLPGAVASGARVSCVNYTPSLREGVS